MNRPTITPEVKIKIDPTSIANPGIANPGLMGFGWDKGAMIGDWIPAGAVEGSVICLLPDPGVDRNRLE
jgi:hypothetical protein